MSEHLAFRAAGQAVAALLHCAPIANVDIEGIEIEWPDIPSRRPRWEVMADIAIGPAGIAARDRHQFGCPASGDFVVSWSFTPSQVEDFAAARELVDAIDPSGDADVLFQAWRQAIDFVADALVWQMIETVAAALEDRQPGRSEIAQIAAAVLVMPIPDSSEATLGPECGE